MAEQIAKWKHKISLCVPYACVAKGSKPLFPVYCYRQQRPDRTQRSKLRILYLSHFRRNLAKLITCDLRLHAGTVEYRNRSCCVNRWFLRYASLCRQGSVVTRTYLSVRLLCLCLPACGGPTTAERMHAWSHTSISPIPHQGAILKYTVIVVLGIRHQIQKLYVGATSVCPSFFVQFVSVTKTSNSVPLSLPQSNEARLFVKVRAVTAVFHWNCDHLWCDVMSTFIYRLIRIVAYRASKRVHEFCKERCYENRSLADNVNII
jgi:hypothetical protein